MINRVVFLVLIALVLTFSIAFAFSGSIERHVISSGGGQVQSGKVNIHATIGQPVAGVTEYSTYEIQSGFWNGSVPEYDIFLPSIMN